MKTILLLSSVLLASAVGCGKDTPGDKPNGSAASQSAQPAQSSEPSKKPEMTFQVMATVTEIDEAKGKIRLDHEKMEGYMEAMEMPFKVSNPEVFRQVTVGAKGHFTVEVTDGIGVVTGVQLSK